MGRGSKGLSVSLWHGVKAHDFLAEAYERVELGAGTQGPERLSRLSGGGVSTCRGVGYELWESKGGAGSARGDGASSGSDKVQVCEGAPKVPKALVGGEIEVEVPLLRAELEGRLPRDR